MSMRVIIPRIKQKKNNHLSIYLSISVHLSIHSIIYLSIYLSIYSFINPTIHLFIPLPIDLYIYISIHLSIHSSIYTSIHSIHSFYPYIYIPYKADPIPFESICTSKRTSFVAIACTNVLTSGELLFIRCNPNNALPIA